MRRRFVFTLALTYSTASAAFAQPSGDEQMAVPVEENDVPSLGCSIAAPACFHDCTVGMIRTASSLCVPAQHSRPFAASGEDQALSVSMLDADSEGAGVPREQPAPVLETTGRSCCYVPLRVSALGVINLGDHAETRTLQADVRINGRIVGQTDFADALPVGDYVVEVELPGEIPQRAEVKLRPGQGSRLQAKYRIQPNRAQRDERDRWRRERAARLQAEMAAAAARRRAELVARHHTAIERWTEETKADRARRQLHHISGFSALLGGVASAVVGTALVVSAAATHDEARSTYWAWQNTVRSQERDMLAAEVKGLERARDSKQGFGIAALVLGGIGVTGGFVLLLTAPKVAKKPQTPPGLDIAIAAEPGTGAVRVSFQL